MIERAAAVLLNQHAIGMRPEHLAAALEASEAFVLADAEELCDEGGVAQEMWVLLSGFIEVRKRGLPEDQPLAIVSAPALLGHMGLVNGTQRSASCRARGRCDLLRLPATRFYELLADQTPAGHIFRRLLIASMNRQLERGNDRLQRVSNPDELLEATVSLDGWSKD